LAAAFNWKNGSANFARLQLNPTLWHRGLNEHSNGRIGALDNQSTRRQKSDYHAATSTLRASHPFQGSPHPFDPA